VFEVRVFTLEFSMTAIMWQIGVYLCMLFLVVTLCGLIGRSCFGETYYLHLQGFSPPFVHSCAVDLCHLSTAGTADTVDCSTSWSQDIWHTSDWGLLNGFQIPLCRWPRQHNNDQKNTDHEKWRNSTDWQKNHVVLWNDSKTRLLNGKVLVLSTTKTMTCLCIS
jgi:hypothetical protein